MRDLTRIFLKMAIAIATFKIMPVDPEQDLDRITAEAEKLITGFAGDTEHRVKREPIAFGLVAVMITFVVDEAKGGLDPLQEEIAKVEGVNSCDLSDWRRAIG